MICALCMHWLAEHVDGHCEGCHDTKLADHVFVPSDDPELLRV